MAEMIDISERIEHEKARGFWPEKTIEDYFHQQLERTPGAIAIIEHRADRTEVRTITYAELDLTAGNIAGNLARLGVEKGDAVSFQLPNWWEFVAVHLACVRVGAISNPLMPIFRQRELSFMIANVEAKVLIVPESYKNFDHQALGRELLEELDCLSHLFVVGGEGADSFEQCLLANCDTPSPLSPLEPNDLMQVLYTSGTTGQPKGVMHTANTLFSSIVEFSREIGLNSGDTVYMPSPLAHQTGFCYGIMMATYHGSALVITDVWDPVVALQLIEKYGVAYTFAATPFLSDLTNAQSAQGRDISKFRMFITAGAPISPTLVVNAREILKTSVMAGWGMTEVGMATVTPKDGSRIEDSDGKAIAGSEVRVIDKNGGVLPFRVEGRLQYRGSFCCIGYYNRPDLQAVDEDGWFETGDNAIQDETGFIRITGRSKDIIIRGGENIPVVEVENLVLGMEEVSEAALVAMPDTRLNEKGCLFVSLTGDHALTLEDVCGYLTRHNLTRQYLPERLEIIDEFPRTPSGKIQKFELRERARALPL
jgi:cyclohexanecarboxylate-CoA ligase